MMSSMAVAFWLPMLSVVWSVTQGLNSTSTATSSPVSEFCHAETFQPSCAADEVVIIESAQFGRLNIGRCVTEDFGYLRCLHDVLPEVESACSGRRTCKLRVDDVTFSRMTPCHRDLKSNLLTSYRCTKVIVPNTPCSFPPGGESIIDTTLSSTATSGFISSYVTEATGCGTADWPWTIRTGPGQRINLTLFDYSLEASISSSSFDGSMAPNDADKHQNHAGRRHGTAHTQPLSASMTCRVYATIRDGGGGRSTTVCGGLSKTVGVFVSATNRVEIRFLRQQKSAPSSGSGQQQSVASSSAVDYPVSYFLLRYEVIGCVDPPIYYGMRMKRDNDVVTISCDVGTSTPDAVWQMTCVGNRWVGFYGNCTNSDNALVSGLFTNTTFSYASPVIIIVVIAICVVCFILTVGTFCIRWRLRKDYAGRYSGDVRTEPVDVISDYDYQYHTTSAHHQPPLGITADKAGMFPIRGGGHYPQTTPGNYDTTSSAAVLTGNEYATMRLLQLAQYTDLPPGVGPSDRLYNADGSRTPGCVMTEHIYESPDSMRRIPFVGGGQAVVEDFDPASIACGDGIRPQYRVFEPGTAVTGSGSPWDHQRARMMQYQQQMSSATGSGVPRAVVPNAVPGAMYGGNGGERYEMPMSGVAPSGEQQRFASPTTNSGNYSL